MKMMGLAPAKRKPGKQFPRDLCYDAFVSYSEGIPTAENLMVQELEHFNLPLSCVFISETVPGKWIITNIIDSIEKSRKPLLCFESFCEERVVQV